MRAARGVLMVLLLAAAAPARADWVPVDKGDRGFFSAFSGGTRYYIDPTSIAREGNIRRVWEIHDLGDKGPQGERSVLASVEYDCVEKRMRTVKATGKSQAMARGEIIPLRAAFDDWIVLQPGRDDATLFKILDLVCAP
jgi:hypothetical protein